MYRARDARLHREVALKVLPEAMSFDTDRLARLEREAQVLASLSHPNIAAIHGLEESAGVRALVLELVEGPTLADRIAAGALPLDEAMPIARQIASALEAAHDAGIIHRDLKPANIKIRPDGTVKVLDFGLAKAVEGRSGHSGTASMSPTLTTPAVTGIGTILGTAAYMAPEQARGRTLDKRADIWAFGCVLYEMLTGRRAFEGSDVTDVLASVIKSDPDWGALPADVPVPVRTTLKRCLQKDVSQRFRDIGDVRLALDGSFHSEATPLAPVAAAVPGRNVGRSLLWATGGVIAGALIAAAGAWALLRPAPAPLVKLTAAHAGAEQVGGAGSDVAVTPEGRTLVYLASEAGGTRSLLYVRALDQLAATRLAPNIENVGNLFLSADGRWIGFVDQAERSVKKVATSGGPALSVGRLPANVQVVGAAWGPDDTVVFGTASGPLMLMPANGGTPSAITKVDPTKGELAHRHPEFLPNGDILFTVSPLDAQPESSYVALLDRQTGAYRPVIQAAADPQYLQTGHIVYVNAGFLRAVAFDLDGRAVRGTPVTLAEGVSTKASSTASFAVSPAGTLTYIAGSAVTGRRMVVWVDRSSGEEPLDLPVRAYAYARLSPDGQRIALDIRDEGNDIWTWDLTRRTLTRLTFDPGFNRGPSWMPDGRHLLFSAVRDGAEYIHMQPADGSSPARSVGPGGTVQIPDGVSPDGKWVLFVQPSTPPYDIYMMNLDGQQKPQVLLGEGFSETNPNISPDGRWLAYQSDESGKDEIYVRPFPHVSGGRWQVSTNGGTRPLWSRDGRELFYYLPPGIVMAAAVTPGSTFSAAAPTQIIKGTFLAPQTGRMYDVTPDGKRFLMLKEARAEGERPAPPQLVVVQNWIDELKRAVPAN